MTASAGAPAPTGATTASLRSPVSAGESLLAEWGSVGRAVTRLAWPIILENLSVTALGIVDVLLVSRLGAEAIAGVGAGVQFVFFTTSTLAALTVGTTVLVARLVGARDLAGANRAAKQSLVLGLAAGLLLLLAGRLLASTAVQLLGPEPAVAALGATYLQIVLTGSVFTITSLLCSSALRGAGDSRTPMLVNLAVNAVNALLAYNLIFGHFGLPALGVAGAALALISAQALGATALLLVLWSGASKISIAGRHDWWPDLRLMRRILNIGLPAMGESVLFSGAMLVYSAMVITLGTDVFAAMRITFNAVSVSFMLALGFGMAATTLTGQALGAGRPDLAVQATRRAVLSSAVLQIALALTLFVFAEPLVRLFSSEPGVVGPAVAGMHVIALAQPCLSGALVFAGSLRGAGDTRFVMVATAISAWLVRLPVGYVLGIMLGLGLPFVFVGNLFDFLARALVFYHRFRQGRWRSIKV